MGIWKETKTSTGKGRVEIDVNELRLRLKTLTMQGNIEIVQLALQSLVEEIEDYQYQLKINAK